MLYLICVCRYRHTYNMQKMGKMETRQMPLPASLQSRQYSTIGLNPVDKSSNTSMRNFCTPMLIASIFGLLLASLFAGLFGWSFINWRNEFEAHSEDIRLENLCTKIRLIDDEDAPLGFDQKGNEYINYDQKEKLGECLDYLLKKGVTFDKDSTRRRLNGKKNPGATTSLRPLKACELGYTSSEGRCDAGRCSLLCLQSITQRECDDNRQTIQEQIASQGFCERSTDGDLCPHPSWTCRRRENPTTICEGQPIYRSVATPLFSS